MRKGEKESASLLTGGELVRSEEVLKKLGIFPFNGEAFKILVVSLKSLLKYSDSIESLAYWDAPVLPMLRNLEAEGVKLIESEMDRVGISLEECRFKVQKIIPNNIRKRFSVYYTVDSGSRLMASLIPKFLGSRERIVIADPFLGSGITLTSAIKEIGERKVGCVWGIEPLPLPALVAYASILDSLGGRRDSVKVIVGDSFELVPKLLRGELRVADVVLTNPPFTRWRNLERDYRERLISLAREMGYGEYLTRKEVSLQAISLFLCDYALNENGLLISVLPASTLYTIYGKGVKRMFMERYAVHSIISHRNRTSLSEDSGFKEVIIAATKGSSDEETSFIETDGFSSNELASVKLNSVPSFLDINWLVFLSDRDLRESLTEALEEGLASGSLGYGRELLVGSIMRGIEIYGPDFFFIPNRFWKIVEEDEGCVRIARGSEKLTIAKDFLLRVLRKPSLYAKRIDVRADSFMLSVPPLEISELPSGVRDYVKWGMESGSAGPAVRSRGLMWYSHVWKQISVKKPYGRIFLPDKVDISFRNRGVFANYSEEEVAASKDFYVIRSKDETVIKLLVGWFNSTIFISILALLGRRISNTWTRLLERDYLELPIPNLRKGGNSSKVVEIVDDMLERQLPPLWDQLGGEHRYELDLAVADFIGLKDPEAFIKKIYERITPKTKMKGPS